jgi:hypothetical protein
MIWICTTATFFWGGGGGLLSCHNDYLFYRVAELGFFLLVVLMVVMGGVSGRNDMYVCTYS